MAKLYVDTIEPEGATTNLAIGESGQDIIVKGSLPPTPPHEQELRNNEYPELPRMSFHFDKSSFGRLNQLIDAINQV